MSQLVQSATVYKFIAQAIKFDSTDRAKHLTEIHAAPESTWALLAGLLQEHSWSVKDTKAAVDRIRSVADLVPAWLPDVSSVYPKVAMEPGFAKSTAAAGKDGQAAKQEAMRKGEAGEVLLRLIEKQSTSVGTLLDPDTNRTLHLVEINSAPEETQELITSLVLENTWSAKDTKAAVDRIRSVADLVPAWLPDVSSVYPKVAMEPGFAKSTAAAGKDGSAAETEAKRKGCAGEVIQHFLTSSPP